MEIPSLECNKKLNYLMEKIMSKVLTTIFYILIISTFFIGYKVVANYTELVRIRKVNDYIKHLESSYNQVGSDIQKFKTGDLALSTTIETFINSRKAISKDISILGELLSQDSLASELEQINFDLLKSLERTNVLNKYYVKILNDIITDLEKINKTKTSNILNEDSFEKILERNDQFIEDLGIKKEFVTIKIIDKKLKNISVTSNTVYSLIAFINEEVLEVDNNNQREKNNYLLLLSILTIFIVLTKLFLNKAKDKAHK